MHGLAGRRVLDQLHQLVLEDHLAGSRGDVLADLEGRGVGHGDLQAAATLLQVLQEMAKAVQQVLAVAVAGLLEHGRIAEREVARRQRRGHLAGVEIDLLLVLGVQTLDVAEHVVHPARGEQVGLLDVVEDERLGPGFVLEATVAPFRLDQGLRFLPGGPLQRIVPELQAVLPEAHLRLDELRRVGRHARGRGAEGGEHAGWIDDREFVAAVLAFEEGLDHTAALLGELRPGARHLVYVEARACVFVAAHQVPPPQLAVRLAPAPVPAMVRGRRSAGP